MINKSNSFILLSILNPTEPLRNTKLAPAMSKSNKTENQEYLNDE